MKLWLRRLVFGILYGTVALAVALTWPLAAALLWLADDPVSFRSWMAPWVGALRDLPVAELINTEAARR